MSNKAKHNKKVINQFKFTRILNNPDTMMCHVYINRNGEVISGQGVYLNKKVYIVVATGYYAYTVKETGVHADNMAFQLLHLANPF